MIKKIAWETFKKTGNIDTFMELKQIEGIEEHGLESFKQDGKNSSSYNQNNVLDSSYENGKFNHNQ
ncbi:MAG: hypothetical protein HFJ34_01790 [Clostridia bacterium]|nr:hypothetical protein [Clostridia bacterium]